MSRVKNSRPSDKAEFAVGTAPTMLNKIVNRVLLKLSSCCFGKFS
jgi:hypothetical protein